MTDAELENEHVDIIAFASEMLGFQVPAICGDGIRENLRLSAVHRRNLDSYLAACADAAQS